MFREESRVAKCLEKGNWKEDETNLTSSNVYNTGQGDRIPFVS